MVAGILNIKKTIRTVEHKSKLFGVGRGSVCECVICNTIGKVENWTLNYGPICETCNKVFVN